MPKIVSMINWKGGVGKSTLSLHLGVGIMRSGSNGKRARVLLVDLDPQCNLSYLALGVSGYIDYVYDNKNPTLKNLFDSYFKGEIFKTSDAIIGRPIKASPGNVWLNVDLLPSHHELVLVDMRLAREKKSGTTHQEETKYEIDKLSIINNAIAQVADQYDYVILDCPPNINLVTQNSFFASDSYVIPAIPDFLSTVGISLIRSEMDRMNKSFGQMIGYAGVEMKYSNADLKGIIFNMVDEYGGGPKNTHRATINSTGVQHPGMVFDNYVTDGDGISTAADSNMTVYSYDHFPKARANGEKQADALMKVSQEFIAKI
ncbi:ParA family protein (plasmid) [Ralstonia solanacearum P673]|uniref:ParA family protein n=1 Tax=Ralstonia solanacearum TaxID=305 RepID=UPI002029FC03|nr:AAA family ATPase [Ralstonia solanacearum]MCL9849316.1 AAA family ATPase [Ralstonia solanacearum]MCL9856037.1 AAA family ATPase [Ralstonia solanacearum]MCL9861524.1 AAA family ATPase [Ralstonia solanacearum]MCL9865785.1 AAA family ATPase [Ralstonia solanacearum]MCL9870555.1 AAA family ATPase [Ralstonia solanacearum]